MLELNMIEFQLSSLYLRKVVFNQENGITDFCLLYRDRPTTSAVLPEPQNSDRLLFVLTMKMIPTGPSA